MDTMSERSNSGSSQITITNQTLEKLLNAVKVQRLQDAKSDFTDDSPCTLTEEIDITDEILLLLATHAPSISNIIRVAELLKSEDLNRYHIYLALAALQDVSLVHTFLSQEFRIATGENRQIVEYLLSNKRTLALQLCLLTIKNAEDWLTFIVKLVESLLSSESCLDNIRSLLECSPLTCAWELVVLHLLQKGSHNASLLRAALLAKEKDKADPALVELSSYLYHRLSLLDCLEQNTFGPIPELRTTPLSSLRLLQKSCILSNLDWERTHSVLVDSVKTGVVSSWEPAVLDAVLAITCTLEAIQLASTGLTRSSKYFFPLSMEQHYEDNVVGRLTRIKKIVNQMQPLTLRVEVLENIFAILFIRHEDLVDDEAGRISESGTEDEDGNSSLANQLHDASLTDVSLLESRVALGRRIRSAPKTESSAPRKQGFLCGPNITRDVLVLLKESVLAASAAFYAALSSDGPEWSAPSAVQQHELQTHIKQLSSYVLDALGRLEVLTGPEFLRSEGHYVVEDSSCFEFPQEWSYVDPNQSESDSDDESESKTLKKTAKLKKSDAERSSGSSSPAFPSGAVQTNKAMWKSRKRSQTGPSFMPESTATIQRMLCTPASLTNHCLLRGDLQKAEHIVQIFNITETISGAEVHFSEEYRKLQRRHGAPTYGKECKNLTSSQNKTLQAIQHAASAGVQALQVRYDIDELLSSIPLPEVPNVDAVSGGSPKQHAIVVAAADVTLTLAKNAQQTRNFIGLATQRYPELLQLHPGTQSLESAAYCFIPFLRSLLQVTETSEEGSPLALLQRWDLDDYSARSIRDHIQFVESLNIALTEWYSNRNDAAFSKLVQVAALVNSLKGSDTNKPAYLQELQTYLQELQKILSSLSPSGMVGSQYTDLLKYSPFEMFSLLFEQGVSEHKLKMATASLGMTLSFILPVRLIPSPPSVKLSTGSKAAILNDGVWPAAARVPSLVASSLLEGALHELLVQWKELQLVNGKACRNLPISVASSPRLQAVLADTKELAVIDLDLLREGEETVAFFCNVTNLLMLHSLLYTEANGGDLIALISPTRAQRMCYQSTLFYRVGQLGPVSLWQMLQLTLGHKVMNVPSLSSANILLKRNIKFGSRDPRLLLAIATGCPTSPVVQVMRSRRLNEQLDGAVREYVRFWTRVRDNKVEVPALTKRYLHTADLPVTSLLKYCDFLGTKQDDLELSVFPEQASNAVFVLTYGTTYKWPEEKNETVEAKPNTADLQMSNTLSYLEKHCWPVALLVKLVHSNRLNEIEHLEISHTVIRRLLEMPSVLELASLLEVSVGFAAIQSCIPNSLLWNSLENLIENRSWRKVVDLLSALPTYQLKEDSALQALRDLALLELIIEGPTTNTPTPWRYCYHLSSANLRANCALACAPTWPGEECCQILSHLVQDPTMEEFPQLKAEITSLLAKVRVCQNVLSKFQIGGWHSWKDVLDCGKSEPLKLLECIKDPALCLQWSQLFPLPSVIPQTDVDRIVKLLLQVDECDLSALERVLSNLPRARTAHTLVNFLPNVPSVPLARFVLRFLDSVCRKSLSPPKLEVLQLALLGLQMIEILPPDEQDDCLRLMTLPHLLLEEMLMNMRLEIASSILTQVRENLTELSPGSPMSLSSVDHLLRTYAEKALDFRVAVAYSDHGDNLSCSVSSYTSSRGKDFIMPVHAPSKNDWIPNEKAAVCMPCGVVVFSMFNRRHHCRRCGRVICAGCSLNRLQVEGYGSLKVRVCNDCFNQSTRGQSFVETASSIIEPHKLGSMACSSEAVWQLTPSQSINNTIREEFAYEHAPSVSICLSILQLHSQHPAFPSFLFDCCDKILDHLKPIAPSIPNPEVDYSLVIQMCGNMVVAAKVKCAQWGYNSGVFNCDRLLSEIDLFRLLVDHGCAGLIMYEVKAAKGGSSLLSCAQDLRQLRNRLLKEELWELALEVSTKGGLDRNGVWAVWGKGCLTAGCWEKARDKFAQCFVTSPASSRPTKDPPLLLEILQILENLPKGNPTAANGKSQKVESKQKTSKTTRQNAETVLLSLASLQDIVEGKLEQASQTSAGAGIDAQIYTECCYYLRTYGSHALCLHFLLRHRDFEKALRHVLDNALDAQSFFDWLYIPCLKSGLITDLHTAMTSIDSTLKTWTNYLRGVCGILERRRLVHVLYEVQQWAGDHVRAAMTCIRFFRKGASSYSELVGRLKHLKYAQAHLDAALAEVSAIQGQSTTSSKEAGNVSGQSIPLILPPSELCRHQTTIWRQIELTKFLANCEASGRPVLANCDPPLPTGSALPTLFNTAAERERLADLAILCGTDVDEGFGISIRIVGDFKLNAEEMYKRVAVGLIRQHRVQDILRLLECIRTSGAADISRVSDEILLASVEAGTELSPAQSEMLVKNISDNALKVKAYIACRLLKSAYLLAVKNDRQQDVEIILEEAERLDQSAIRNICLKRLGRL